MSPRALELGFIDAEIEGEVRAGTTRLRRRWCRAGAARAAPRSAASIRRRATPAIIERLTAQARSQYPHRSAALTAIKAVCSGRAAAVRAGAADYETELANRTKATVESKALVHVFFAERETRKVPGLPAEVRGTRDRERRGHRRRHDGRRHRDLLRQCRPAGDA